MISRRDLVRRVAALTAVLGGAGWARAGSAATRIDSSFHGGGGDGLVDGAASAGSEEGLAPWEFLRPLSAGETLPGGWRLVELGAAVNGSCVLTLTDLRGHPQRVHLCRHHGHPRGLVFTEGFDFLVMNGGHGDLPSDEGLSRALAAVASVVAVNEQRPLPAQVAALLSHDERLEKFSGRDDQRLR